MQHTVIWAMRAHPAIHTVTLPPDTDPTTLSQDDWLSLALIQYFSDGGIEMTFDEAISDIEEYGHSLVAVTTEPVTLLVWN